MGVALILGLSGRTKTVNKRVLWESNSFIDKSRRGKRCAGVLFLATE
jgi:hypothetical protein